MPLAYLSAAPRLWLVRFLAVSALTASMGLTVWKWMQAGSEIPGCGVGIEGCGAVLESRWSLWFSVPVTLLAASLWLTVLILTLPKVQHALGHTADQLVAATGALLVGGALWFGGLLLLVVKAWCVWCLALHLTALLVGGLILYSIWRAEKAGGPGLLTVAGQTACAGLALLVVGQLFGTPPDTHLLTSDTPPLPPPSSSTQRPESVAATSPVSSGSHSSRPGRPAEMITRGNEREVVYLKGTLTLSLADHPLIGSPAASHILTEFFDYTCPTCRTLHGDLSDLQKSAPGEYAVLLLPTPLNHACNPSLPEGAADHPHACELAQLALAFWHAAPGKFPAFHDFLMTAAAPLTPEAALHEARRLAPAANLDSQSTDWISERLAANAEIWKRISQENPKMPKLLLRDALIMHGAPVSRERFQEVIQSAFPIGSPLSDVPVIAPRR
jgi:uncharacterized membrane protein